MKKIVVIEGQDLIDISLSAFGTPEAVFDIALANDKSITDQLFPGEVLILPEYPTENNVVFEYYSEHNVVVATNSRSCQNPYYQPGFVVEDYISCN